MKLYVPHPVPVPYQLVDRIVAANPTVPAEEAVLAVLQRGADAPLHTNDLVLHGDLLDRLAELLGVGSTRTPATLLAAVQRLCDVRIGKVQMDFTPAEQEELKERARRNQRTPAEEALAVVRSMHEQFFSQPIGV